MACQCCNVAGSTSRYPHAMTGQIMCMEVLQVAVVCCITIDRFTGRYPEAMKGQMMFLEFDLVMRVYCKDNFLLVLETIVLNLSATHVYPNILYTLMHRGLNFGLTCDVLAVTYIYICDSTQNDKQSHIGNQKLHQDNIKFLVYKVALAPLGHTS